MDSKVSGTEASVSLEEWQGAVAVIVRNLQEFIIGKFDGGRIRQDFTNLLNFNSILDRDHKPSSIFSCLRRSIDISSVADHPHSPLFAQSLLKSPVTVVASESYIDLFLCLSASFGYCMSSLTLQRYCIADMTHYKTGKVLVYAPNNVVVDQLAKKISVIGLKVLIDESGHTSN
nr:hypothetical protein Itr_chr12CG12780 [Ipomoea trifida]